MYVLWDLTRHSPMQLKPIKIYNVLITLEISLLISPCPHPTLRGTIVLIFFCGTGHFPLLKFHINGVIGNLSFGFGFLLSHILSCLVFLEAEGSKCTYSPRGKYAFLWEQVILLVVFESKLSKYLKIFSLTILKLDDS